MLRKGEIRIVEVEPRGRNSVGLFGSALGPTTRGDGGTETTTTATATAERSAADTYCGTEYATEDGWLVLYCTYHEEELASMDACESWTGRNRS